MFLPRFLLRAGRGRVPGSSTAEIAFAASENSFFRRSGSAIISLRMRLEGRYVPIPENNFFLLRKREFKRFSLRRENERG
jgi:hypothetical protein